MTSINLILGGVSCAFCGMEVSPSRAGGFHAPITETHSLKIRLPAPQSAPVTSFGRVIDAILPLRRKLVARKLERGGPVFGARSLATLFSSHKGPLRLIQNFCRRFGSGKPSFLRSLVQHPEKSGRRVAQALFLAPAFLSVPVLHASNRHQKDTRDHGNSYPQHG